MHVYVSKWKNKYICICICNYIYLCISFYINIPIYMLVSIYIYIFVLIIMYVLIFYMFIYLWIRSTGRKSPRFSSAQMQALCRNSVQLVVMGIRLMCTSQHIAWSAVKVTPVHAFAAGGPAQQHVPAPAPASSLPPQQHLHGPPVLAALQLPPCLQMLAGRPPGLATAGNNETACQIPSTLQAVIICNSKSVLSSNGILKECRVRVMSWTHVYVSCILTAQRRFDPLQKGFILSLNWTAGARHYFLV